MASQVITLSTLTGLSYRRVYGVGSCSKHDLQSEDCRSFA